MVIVQSLGVTDKVRQCTFGTLYLCVGNKKQNGYAKRILWKRIFGEECREVSARDVFVQFYDEPASSF